MAQEPRHVIQSKFDIKNRFSCFGNALIRIRVQGFRCHTDTIIDIKSPITAFCGQNGTGKSTLLQLAAVAYKNPYNIEFPDHKISDFMVIGSLDPRPFRIDAKVEFHYWDSDSDLKTVTISRSGSRWSGYNRRPIRHVFFTGVGHYLPQTEARSILMKKAAQLAVEQTTPLSSSIRQWISTILACNYNQLYNNAVSYEQNQQKRNANVVSANRNGVTYSEANMGYGEGRMQSLISGIESLPRQSLVFIEEPETSLHPSAQYKLGEYLVDVVNRNHHQVFLTTHSAFLLNALPSASIYYLKRMGADAQPVGGLSPFEVNSLLADGHVKALCVLVEDDCAQYILHEIIRHVNPDFLKVIDIHIGGDATLIANTVKSLKGTHMSVACVRDADKGPSPKENIFKLPGTMPPEKELFASPSVAIHIRTMYGVDLHDFMTQLLGFDHHEWVDHLARRVNQVRHVLLGEIARAYAETLSELEVSILVGQLKEAAQS